MDDGDTVYGLRRDPTALPPGVIPVAADLTDRGSLHGVPVDADAVVYAASADARDESAYRAAYVDGLHHLLWSLEERGGRPHRLLYSSSTGVYGQEDGSFVDEDSPTEPARPTGHVLLEGEGAAIGAGVPAVIVRFGGIYGPGRTRLLESVRSGRAMLPPGAEWTNRIHRDDCAGVLRHLLRLDAPHTCYVGVDCESADRRDVLRHLAQLVGAPPPSRDGTQPEEAPRGKRCRNDRLLASGYRFRYPSYREGYGELARG